MDYNHAIQRVGEVIDAAGVAIMFVGSAIAAVAATVRLARHDVATYRRFRQQLGQAILLGLELLVAGDIVRTVAAQPTLTSIAVLAGIVLIRTFLSFSLEVELTGRWPWQSGTSMLPPEEPAPPRRLGLRILRVLRDQLQVGDTRHRQVEGELQTAVTRPGFGRTQAQAVSTAGNSLSRLFGQAEQEYQSGWAAYDAGLKPPPAHVTGVSDTEVRDHYYLSANVLKASEDKTYPGAIVAPWPAPGASRCRPG